MNEYNKTPTALGRIATRSREVIKPRNCRKFHTSLTEKLRKYEVRPAGHEFVPAMMHMLNRCLAGKEPETWSEVRLAKAVEALGDDARFLQQAVKTYQGLDVNLKSRAFSTRYMSYPIDRAISDSDLKNMIARANVLKGWTRGTLAARAKRNVDCCCCDGSPQDPPPPPPERNDYTVTFSHLYCVDESNPEWPGSDEPYVVFATTTEAMVESGVPAWGVNTKVYGDVDDGDRRPSSGEENLFIYGKVAAKPIDSPFLIAATCMEHDNGSPSEVSAGLRSSLTTVATTAAGIGGPAGWIVAGAAAIGVGITFLVDLWAEDDQIGDILTLSFTEANAEALTAAVNPKVLDPLHFDGGSSDGIYDVYLKLTRS